MKTQTSYFVEITDTFAGEANYAWVRRYKAAATTEQGAISKAAKESGYRFLKDSFAIYKARGACVIAFVEDWDDETHGQYNTKEI